MPSDRQKVLAARCNGPSFRELSQGPLCRAGFTPPPLILHTAMNLGPRHRVALGGFIANNRNLAIAAPAVIIGAARWSGPQPDYHAK